MYEEELEKKERLAAIGEMHLEIERQLQEFNSIVPYKYNFMISQQLYSPRLYNLLQGTCSCVDSAMKLLCEFLSIVPERHDMPNYLKVLNDKNMLAVQKVIPRHSQEILQPFMISEGETVPSWWTAYNKTKHGLVDGGVLYATLGSTTMAVAGLVCLLYICKWFLIFPVHSILDGKRWNDRSGQYIDDYQRLKFDEATTAVIHYDDQPYLTSKEHEFKSQFFYYTMSFSPPR